MEKEASNAKQTENEKNGIVIDVSSFQESFFLFEKKISRKHCLLLSKNSKYCSEFLKKIISLSNVFTFSINMEKLNCYNFQFHSIVSNKKKKNRSLVFIFILKYIYLHYYQIKFKNINLHRTFLSIKLSTMILLVKSNFIALIRI